MIVQPRHPGAITDIRLLETRGPWTTKSNGQLRVQFALPSDLVSTLLTYNQDELHRVPQDIRGLRFYTITGLKQGAAGGGESHRIREEIAFVIQGSLRWTCTDLFGRTQDFILNPGNGIWMPPFVLHSYEVLEDDTILQVFCNTLFTPDDPATHDTYSHEEFAKLRHAVV